MKDIFSRANIIFRDTRGCKESRVTLPRLSPADLFARSSSLLRRAILYYYLLYLREPSRGGKTRSGHTNASAGKAFKFKRI